MILTNQQSNESILVIIFKNANKETSDYFFFQQESKILSYFLIIKNKKILLAQATELFTSKVDARLRKFLVITPEFQKATVRSWLRWGCIQSHRYNAPLPSAY